MRHKISPSFDYHLGLAVSQIERNSYYGGVGSVALPGMFDYHAATYEEALEESKLMYGYTDTTRFYGDILLSHALRDHLVTWGGQYQRDEVFDEKRNDLRQSLTTTGETAAFRGEDPIAAGSFRNIGVFLQDEWDPHPFWTVISGIRADRHSNLRKWIYSPRVAVRYGSGSAWIFRASVATGFRAPEIFDEDFHVEILDDPTRTRNAEDLREESSVSYAAGFVFTPYAMQSNFQLDVELFHTEIRHSFHTPDIVHYDPAGNAFKVRENGGGSFVQGVEANLLYRFSPQLSVQGGISYTIGQFREAVEILPGILESRFIESPRWSGVARLNYAHEDSWSAFVGLIFTGPMIAVHQEDGFLNRQTNHFFVVDLSLSRRFRLGRDEEGPDLTVTLGIRNLFDQRQSDLSSGPERDPGYLYGPRMPRGFFVSCEFRF